MGEIKALSDSPSIRLEGLPPWLGDGVRHALKNPELTLYKIKHSASKFSVVLVPLAVPFLWLMFAGRRGVFLYDHVVFCLHSLSFMAVLVSALSLLGGAGVPPLPLVWALALIPPVHIFMHLRDAYGLGSVDKGR